MKSSFWIILESLFFHQVAGVTTNIGFLTSLASHPAFQEGDVHTGFIEVRNLQL